MGRVGGEEENGESEEADDEELPSYVPLSRKRKATDKEETRDGPLHCFMIPQHRHNYNLLW